MPRSNLAHVRANGTLDGWNPGANGAVDALALDHGRVYVGGEFTNVWGLTRNHLAAVDSASGNIPGECR